MTPERTTRASVLRMLPLGGYLSALSLTPCDVSTGEGRAAERRRRIALSAAATLAARLLSVLVSFLTVPLTIGYLGNERYGLWLTVSSVVGMIGFADLGIGNGLLTKVADADGRGDREELRRLVSSAFFMLLGVASLLATTTLIAAPFIDWASVLGVTGPAARAEVRSALLLLTLNWYVSMPFSVVQRVQNGLQAGYASTLWTMAGTLLSLAGLLAATTLRAGLPGLIVAISGIPTLVIIANFAWYFARERPDARPSLSAYERSRATSLLRLGALFTVLQLAGALAYASDNVVIARSLGAEAVPGLAVPAKLFALLSIPVAMVTGALWPAYGEARARGDHEWMRRTLRRSIQSSVLLSIAGGAVLLAVGPPLLRLWTRGSVNAKADVLVPLAIWTCLSVWGQVVAAYLNGVGQIRAQTIAAVLMASSAYGLKLALVTRLGPGGVVWATVVAYVLFAFLPLSWVVRGVLRSTGHAGFAQDRG